jgi:hypothetical protein
MNKNASQLVNELAQFTGTQHYYQISPYAMLTDGTKHLADEAAAYWLMDAIASYLPQFNGREEFIVAKLSVDYPEARLVLDNGNGRLLDRQYFEYTNFPISNLQLYACWGREYWVIMLTSEY